MQRDAYFAAAVVPSYITAVLLGSLTVIFVPIFLEYEIKKTKKEAWKVASICTNLTFLVLFGISLLGVMFARQLISVTAPGFNGEELSLTASLLRIIFPSVVFSGLSNLLSSIHYAHHQFLRPAAVPIINAVLILSSVIVLTRYWGIKSLAFGNLVGAVVGFAILVPVLFKQGRYCFSFDFNNQGVRQIITVMSPLVFAGLFIRATIVIERIIASTLPTGSISYLGYASKITQTIGTIATAGISTTIFPLMTRAWSENDLSKVRKYFAKAVRIIMLITFPMAAIFTVLRVPIIQIIFERGTFDHNTTLAVANVTAILMVWFICGGLGNVIGKGFYISQKTKLLAVLAICHTIIYIGYSYFLAIKFSYIGLAAANSLRSFLPIIINIFIMRKLYNGIHGQKILDGFVKLIIASAICCILTYSLNTLNYFSNNLALRIIVAGMIGTLTYFFMILYIFKIEEAIKFKTKAIHTIHRAASLFKESL